MPATAACNLQSPQDLSAAHDLCHLALAVWDRDARGVRTLALSLGLDLDDSRQEVALHVWRQALRLRAPPRRPAAWVVTLAVRRVLDLGRTRAAQQRLQVRLAQEVL